MLCLSVCVCRPDPEVKGILQPPGNNAKRLTLLHMSFFSGKHAFKQSFECAFKDWLLLHDEQENIPG